MLFSETFMEVRLVDFIPIITVFISTYLIYWYYKRLDKNKEQSKIKDVFIKLKQDLKFYIPSLNNGKVNSGSFEGNIDYYRSQQDYLIKLGVIVKGSVGLFYPEPKLESLPVHVREIKSPMLKILNIYYVTYRTDGGIDIMKTGPRVRELIKAEVTFITRMFDVESMFTEMIEYANKTK